jgi:ABC-type Fe3+-siderophore transport system permease subunit
MFSRLADLLMVPIAGGCAGVLTCVVLNFLGRDVTSPVMIPVTILTGIAVAMLYTAIRKHRDYEGYGDDD